MMRRMQGVLLVLAGIGLLFFAGCGVSEQMRQLPAAPGLVPLNQLENHLDYRDPYEGAASYKAPAGGGR